MPDPPVPRGDLLREWCDGATVTRIAAERGMAPGDVAAGIDAALAANRARILAAGGQPAPGSTAAPSSNTS